MYIRRQNETGRLDDFVDEKVYLQVLEWKYPDISHESSETRNKMASRLDICYDRFYLSSALRLLTPSLLIFICETKFSWDFGVGNLTSRPVEYQFINDARKTHLNNAYDTIKLVRKYFNIL